MFLECLFNSPGLFERAFCAADVDRCARVIGCATSAGGHRHGIFAD